jgi:hypothetical protein
MQVTITATEIEAMNQKQLLAHLGMTAKEAQVKFTDAKVSLSKQLREYAITQLNTQVAEVAEVVDQTGTTEVIVEDTLVGTVKATEAEYFVSQPEESQIDFEGSLEQCIVKADELAVANKKVYAVYNQDGKLFYQTKAKQSNRTRQPSANKSAKQSVTVSLDELPSGDKAFIKQIKELKDRAERGAHILTLVEKYGIKQTTQFLNLSHPNIVREANSRRIYDASEVIRNLYQDGSLSWAAIHSHLAPKSLKKVTVAELEQIAHQLIQSKVKKVA